MSLSNLRLSPARLANVGGPEPIGGYLCQKMSLSPDYSSGR
jgi:hypothetical protein